MKIKRILIVLSVIIAILAGISYMRYQEDKMYRNRGQVLIDKIEHYRSIHKLLPDDISSLGENETMSDGPYYEKVDSNIYRIYFCLGFDDYKVYDSRDKKWSDERD